MKGIAITLLAVLAMVQLMVGPSEALTCGQINGALATCLPYLTRGGGPSGQCCAGVRNVKNMTPTRADRQTACNCLKQISSHYQNIRDDAANSLPAKCKVQVNIPIARNTDCSRVP